MQKTRRQRSCIENGKDEAAFHLRSSEKQALYAGGHKHHFLSLLSVSSLTARPQALDEALGGEGSRSAALLPAIDGRILQLFATMETNSRDRQGPNREPLRQHELQFKVRRRFVCFDRRISVSLIFISIIFLWQSCLASTRRPPLSSDIFLRRLLDLTEIKTHAVSTRAEFARRSMEIPPAVQQSRHQENVAK